jgi:hypothetical protein
MNLSPWLLPFLVVLGHAATSTQESIFQRSTKQILTGHINPEQVFSFVYIPFEVKTGTTSIYVLQSYSDNGNGNSLDLGVFDQRGHHIMDGQNGTSGYRGWSGGFRSNFTISPAGATPGYDAGPIMPGTWSVVLGPYASNPGGIDWQLDIELGFDPVTSYFSTDYASTSLDPFPSIFPSKDTWLRGDFHAHTIYSDGRYTPEQQISNALQRQLDFMFFTDHNTDSSNNIMGAFAPPSLLVCRGIEVTTRHGHWQALGVEREQIIEWRYHPGDTPGFPEAVHQVRRAGGLVSVNHPFQNCSRCDWGFDYEHNDAIEVWNGKWDPTDERAVRKWHEELVTGKRVTGIGGSDAHGPPDVLALPTTVVRSHGLNQAAIIDGMRQGHVYLVQDPGMSLELTVDADGVSAGIGDTIAVRGDAVATLRATGMAGNKACFVSEAGYLRNHSIVDGEVVEQMVSNLKLVRVEIRNVTDGMIGLTNPVYFG